jgi:RNA polymerase sigma-70 factor (ECF subfamily)
MTQETFLRAWRRRETFRGEASVRAWLYKIATNACLDALKQSSRRYLPVTREAVSTLAQPIPPEVKEPIWLEPYPDEWLIVADDDPEQQVTTRESIKIAFIAALQLLPPRQRAVLILRDVLDWQANEVADLLDVSVPAVKSLLHRARSTLATRSETADRLDEAAQSKLDAYVQAWENADIDALLTLLKEDATFSMPPIPSWYRGRDEIRGLTSMTIFRGQAQGRWRLVPTHANRQPAFGLYRQSDSGYDAYGIQVVTFDGGLIADITTFRNPALLASFNLPMILARG